MKKITEITIALLALIGASIFIYGCSATQSIASKTGSQLWGENCIRCHNAPPSSDYTAAQWEVICMHMKVRANLTEDETNKIMAFLK
jgi:hypothetical protein